MFPEKPAKPNYNGTATHSAQQQEDYKEDLTVFLEARNLQAHIRKLMANAIPNVYMGTTRNQAARYTNINPKDIL
ncbi:hypothetical protein, partial [Staphylococcus aureus]